MRALPLLPFLLLTACPKDVGKPDADDSGRPGTSDSARESADSDTDTDTDADTGPTFYLSTGIITPDEGELVSGRSFDVGVFLTITPEGTYPVEDVSWVLMDETNDVELARGQAEADSFTIPVGALEAGAHRLVFQAELRGEVQESSREVIVNQIPTISLLSDTTFTSCTPMGGTFSIEDDSFAGTEVLALSDERTNADGTGTIVTTYRLAATDSDGDGTAEATFPTATAWYHDNPINWVATYSDGIDTAIPFSTTIVVDPSAPPEVIARYPYASSRVIYDNDADTGGDTGDALVVFDALDDCTARELQALVSFQYDGTTSEGGGCAKAAAPTVASTYEEWRMYCDIPEGTKWDVVITLVDVDGNTVSTTITDVWEIDGSCLDDDNDGWVSGAADTGDAFCSPSLLAEYGDTGWGDCDDGDPGVYPTAVDVCDTADNNCDAVMNEDARDAYDLAGVGESELDAVLMGTFDTDEGDPDTIQVQGSFHFSSDQDWFYVGVGTADDSREEPRISATVELPTFGDYTLTLEQPADGSSSSVSGNGTLTVSATGKSRVAETQYRIHIKSNTWDPTACEDNDTASAGIQSYTLTVTET